MHFFLKLDSEKPHIVIVIKSWFQNLISNYILFQRDDSEKPSASNPQILCCIPAPGVRPGHSAFGFLLRTRRPVEGAVPETRGLHTSSGRLGAPWNLSHS